MKCDLCMNSRVGISENGYHAICCLSAYEARECAFGDGKHFVPLKDFSITDKTSAFDALDTLSSAYWGKQYYFEEEGGKVYSRDSGKYLTLDEAIAEFADRLGEENIQEIKVKIVHDPFDDYLESLKEEVNDDN